MYSVDKSALQFFDSLGMPYDLCVTQAIPYRGARLAKRIVGRALYPKQIHFGELRFSVLKEPDQYEGYSHIVFWGDFLNNPVYGASDFAKRDVRLHRATTKDEGFRRWERLFVYGPVGNGRKVASFGGNFLHCDASLSSQYSVHLKEIIEGFDVIAPRDPYSTRNIEVRADSICGATVLPGLDCAFLLQDSANAIKQKQFAFHFGRSGFGGHGGLLADLEKTLELEAVELSAWFKLLPVKADEQFLQLSDRISGSRFVLTDTYHVAINALRMGVETFCLGREVGYQDGTLGDFKKRALFELLALEQWYICQRQDESELDFLSRSAARVIGRIRADEWKNLDVISVLEPRIEGFRQIIHDFVES